VAVALAVEAAPLLVLAELAVAVMAVEMALTLQTVQLILVVAEAVLPTQTLAQVALA
jgi:hypothetical protein